MSIGAASRSRTRVRRPDAVTCTARATAAASISASPAEGVRSPDPEMSSAIPASASPAATKKRGGSQCRDTSPSRTGVSRMVRLISSPAFVALVSATPYVSSASTAACVTPSPTPTASSRRPGRGGRRAAQTTAMAAAETRYRSASTARTPPATTSTWAAR